MPKEVSRDWPNLVKSNTKGNTYDKLRWTVSHRAFIGSIAKLCCNASSSIVVDSKFKAALAWFGAFVVAWLRVICGYHSWAQVGVGAGLGSLLGSVWVTFGEYLYRQHPTATFGVSWGLYISGATLFISTKMKDWITHERNL